MKTIGIALFVLATLAPAGDARASFHGGVFRGPGAGLPPGAGPSSPATPGSGGGPSTQGGSATSDLSGWQIWWSFNRDPFLNLKAAVHGGGANTGSDDFFLGLGRPRAPGSGLRPSQAVIRGKVVPALLRVLEEERQKDLISASLLALGKIGDEVSDHSRSRLAEAIRPFLKDSNQEISESAAVALGVLAHPSSTTLLAAILEDTPHGRSASDRTSEVPYRTRAFAAYGLGLIGHLSPNEDVRRFIVHTLFRSLENDTSASRDIAVACVSALGLVRLAPDGSDFPEQLEGLPLTTSRENQILRLMSFLEDRGQEEQVRAYVPVGLARLARGIDPSFRERLILSLLATLRPHSTEPAAIQQGAVQAMGILGDADDDAPDSAIRETLVRIATDGERVSRYLALVALARVASREGSGSQSEENAKAVRELLLRRLSRGTTAARPWAALALGLLERLRENRGLATSPDVALALKTALEGTKSPLESGGILIGAGLMRLSALRALALDRVVDGGDDELRSHAAIALGMMGAVDAILPLRDVVAQSRLRPQILREASISLGMLGDKQVVPLLIEMLQDSSTLATQASVASALGFIGDARSVDPLLAMLADDSLTDGARAFASVALGIICDKEPFPWNSKLAVDVTYWLPPPTLTDPAGGKGVLDLL